MGRNPSAKTTVRSHLDPRDQSAPEGAPCEAKEKKKIQKPKSPQSARPTATSRHEPGITSPKTKESKKPKAEPKIQKSKQCPVTNLTVHWGALPRRTDTPPAKNRGVPKHCACWRRVSSLPARHWDAIPGALHRRKERDRLEHRGSSSMQEIWTIKRFRKGSRGKESQAILSRKVGQSRVRRPDSMLQVCW